MAYSTILDAVLSKVIIILLECYMYYVESGGNEGSSVAYELMVRFVYSPWGDTNVEKLFDLPLLVLAEQASGGILVSFGIG